MALSPRVEWPVQAAAPHTHDRVLDIIGRIAVPGQAMRILDVPCGVGALSERLGGMGFDVQGLDLVRATGFRFDERRLTLADLNGGIPFPDRSFDVVVSIEGIEHLENPSFFLRECARVVKPEGRVIITTPNVDSFRARRKRFFDGFYTFFGPDDAMTRKSGHLHPVDMIFFRGACARAGLAIEQITVNEIPDPPVVRTLKNLMRPCFTRKLPREMRGEIPFFGNVMIYVLRKVEGNTSGDTSP